MTELAFAVLDIAPEPYSLAPNLVARLRIEETSGDAVHAALLRCQVKIDAQRRPYSDAEEAALLDLFGPRQRWADTLRAFSWLHATALVQGFSGACEVDLVLPCSYDVEVSGSRYLQAVRDGVVPLELLFSGTVFARGGSGFEVSQIPWDREARYDLPVATWRALMDQHFPNSGWLRLDVDTLDALGAYKSARGLTTWDETMASLLAAREQVV
jgi:uncharacterized protein DUF6084